MSRLAKNISANLLSNVWSTALALLLTPLYVRFLGVESYGLIGFYSSWIAILGIIDTGLSATAMRELAWLSARPAEQGKIPSLLRSLEVAYWITILLFGAGMLAGAWRFGAGWFHSQALTPAAVRTALMLMAVSLIIQIPSGFYVGGLMGLQRQVECATLVAGFGTIRALGAVTVLLIIPDIRAFFLWQIAASVAQTSSMRWSLLRKFSGSGSAVASFAMLRSVHRFAGGITLVTALSVVLTQADKIILGKFVSLEVFGFYMLAWTVASGLSRVSTPLMQAFGPHFTELVSSGDNLTLSAQVRLASRLMSALILPPAALIVLLARPILAAWTRNAHVADGAAALLSIMVVGTVMSACSYPALSVLYSRNSLRPVIIVNLVAVAILLPLLLFAAVRFGAIGTASCWALYGLTVYLSYLAAGLEGLPTISALSSMRDFAVCAVLSFVVAAVAYMCCRNTSSLVGFIGILGFSMTFAWAVTLLVFEDVRTMALGALKWTAAPAH